MHNNFLGFMLKYYSDNGRPLTSVKYRDLEDILTNH